MGRPSDERRAYLRSADQDVSSFPISNFCPIGRYYSAASKALEAFDEAYYCMNLNKAYSLGRRFASFSTEVLPKHDYYKSPDSDVVTLRKNNQNDINRVLDLMERVVALMDEEEIQKKKKREEKERVIRQAELDELKKQQEELQKQQELASTCNLADKLKSLEFMFPKVPVGVGSTQQLPPPPKPDYTDITIDDYNNTNDTNIIPIPLSLDDLKPIPPPPITTPTAPAPTMAAAASNLAGVSTMTAATTNASVSTMATAPLPPPPSYAELMKQKPPTTTPATNAFWDVSNNNDTPFNDDNNNNLQQPLPQPPQPISSPLPIRSRLTASVREYEKLCSQNRIEVFYLSTFQGRITHIPSKDSTNGCTVISPLVASMHLQSDDLGISNSNIARVIDEICPPILLRVRKKLGLNPNAFIIPSDVHDFMVDQNILLQEQFVGVVGGNILDDDHIKGFFHMLETGTDDTPNNKNNPTKNKNMKIAAALFFHEHVVSVVKTVQSNGRCIYDLVDSMPDPRTFAATRTRSKDIDCFKTTLSKYACTKFTQTELEYIDKNNWNADMCDFDPRVFQAFVWKE